MDKPNAIYEFGPFRLEHSARRLLRDNEQVALTPKCFDLLQVLVENRDRAVSKSELITSLWPDTEVEDGNLAFQVSCLRKALGPEAAKWIETVPRHGYRFNPPQILKSENGTVERRTPRRLTPLALAAVVAAAALLFFGVIRRQDESVVAYTAPLPLTSFTGDEFAPSWSPDGRELAFVWTGSSGDDWDIYIKRKGSEQPLRFTSDPRVEMNPVWSPHGSTIAFGRLTDTGTIDVLLKSYPDGPERKVGEASLCTLWGPKGEKFLGWHPDNEHLVVAGLLPGKDCGLSAVAISTGVVVRLTTPPSPTTKDTAPAISSDGTVLAFMRGTNWPAFAIYTAELSTPLSVTRSPMRLTNGVMGESWPAWIPRSRDVLFTSIHSGAGGQLMRVSVASKRTAQIAGHEAKAYQAAVSVDGSIAYATGPPFKTVVERLDLRTGAKTVVAPSNYLQQSAVYSPDETLIAFESERSGKREIWVASADGSQPRQVTRVAGPPVQSPQWSPDGAKISFTVAEPGGRQVYAVPVHSSGSPQRLTRCAADHPVGTWSSDGKWIYTSCNRSGEYRISRLPIAGGEETQLTEHGGMNPRVSPDGRFVYYVTRGEQTKLWRMPSGGGPAVLVASDPFDPVAIHPAADGVYYIARANTGSRPPVHPIRFVDAATGRRRDIATVAGNLAWGLSLTSDRRSVLFSRFIPGTFDIAVVRPARLQ